MDILIIKLGAIGDVIRTTSILQELKAKYKNCKIDWVTRNESFDVLKNNHLISNIYLMDKNLLKRLNKKYGISPSGEGGEYESLVLNCPMFKKRISIKKAHKISESKSRGNYIIESAELVNK